MGNSSKIHNDSSFGIYRFGDCYLDTVERKVFKGEKLLEMASKAFDILQFLIEKQGEVVAKDEILKKVWDDSFVEEGNLSVHVSKLRRLLAADKSNPFIETVSGVGYRFVSRAHKIDKEDWKKHINQDGHLINAAESGSPKADSIAVLPLTNENGDEEIDYLADGITESLINKLSYIPNLRVIARNTVFRYKNLNDIDFPNVGNELDVSNILTGRIRIIRNNIVIAVELINTKDGSQIWGTQINQPFEDIFEIQKSITQTISEKLKTQISENVDTLQSQKVTRNSESYRLYLKGRYFQKQSSIESLNKAIECFQQSISHDATNSYSYIEMASCYLYLYFYEEILHSKTTALTSSLLDKASKPSENIAEYYAVKGNVEMSLKFDMSEAEKNFKKALSLNSNIAEAHYFYSKLLCFSGRFSEALNEIEKMTKLDPISLQTNRNVSRIFLMVGQYENAVTLLKECLDLAPNDYESLLLMGTNLVELGRYEESLKLFKKALNIQYHFETLTMIAYTNILSNKIEEGKRILNQLIAKSKETYVSPIYIAIVYANLGELDMAFEYLSKAYKDGNSNINALKIDKRLNAIRNDPRYNQMLLRIGLPLD